MSARSELILQKLLGLMLAQKGQELHLAPGNTPVLRLDGELEPVKGEEILTEEFVLNLAKDFMSAAQQKTLEQSREVVFSREVSSLGRFRVHAYYQKGAVSMTFKHIAPNVPVFSELGLPDQVTELRRTRRGLIIISGPYDSGRSYLATSLLATIGRERTARIMTLEQSLEHIMTANKGIFEQREVGRDVLSLQAGLAALADEDVDVVYVSDIPDLTVARQVVQLALSGKLVIATVQSDSVIRALEIFVQSEDTAAERHSAQELGDALVASINLRLVRRAGQTGRAYAVEVLLNTLNIKIALKRHDFERVDSMLRSSHEEGLQTLDQHLLKLVSDGRVAAESALRVARDSTWLGEQLGK